MTAKPAKCKKVKFLSDMRARIQTIPTGGGGGGRIASRGRFVPVFLLGNEWQLMIFMGRSGPPTPSVSAHINVSNGLNSHLFIFFAGPGQFTKCLLMISADAKGKASMILFKIKETAHINIRPRVVLKFGVARDDGLDARKCTLHIKQWPRRYEQVEQGSCTDPGFFVRRGRGGGSRTDGQKTVWTFFFSHQLILEFTEWIQWFYYRGEEGVQLLPGGGGVQRNPCNL